MANIYCAVITIPERRSYRERTVADLESHGLYPTQNGEPTASLPPVGAGK
ncbi:MAG: hypothetical protein GX934_03110 [Burkholderiales bacterium]|nr:hypothetical protein [Burkholderiales bacterium]